MAGMRDILSPTPTRLRDIKKHLGEDLSLLAAGVLDPLGFVNGYKKQVNGTQFVTTTLVPDSASVRDRYICNDPTLFTEPVKVDGVWRDAAYGMKRRAINQVLRQHNGRTTQGRDQWQRLTWAGDLGSGSLNGLSATCHASTAPTSTTWTAAGTPFPTATSSAGNAGLQGHLVFVADTITSSAYTNPTVGVILSNTSSALTVDQWYAVPVTGAVMGGSGHPALGSAAMILPGAGWGAWVGLSSDTGAVSASSVLRTADGLFASSGNYTSGTATEFNTNGLSRAYVAATYPSAGTAQYQKTWTFTGSSATTIAKGLLCNSLAAAGSLLILETLTTPNTATVSANGDTVQLTWTVNF